MRVTIVDYGAGNLRSVWNSVYEAGGDPEFATTPEQVAAAERIVLPGVGAAGAAMAGLTGNGLSEALRAAVFDRGVPFLGICVGMQVLASRLHEFGETPGLGWIDGDVAAIGTLSPAGAPVRVPHMGWNRVDVHGDIGHLFNGIFGPPEFYFAHSFALVPTDASVVAATTAYGTELVAAIRIGTAVATQFHPERSQVAGERLIGNFLDWAP